VTRPANLSDGDFADLAKSGLTVETILAAGIYTASGPEVSAILRYGAGAGMVFPNGDGQARVKLHEAGPDGKKYRTPKDGKNRLYLPPPALLSRERLHDATATVYITEGEKKTLRAVQEGLVCIGLAGVWSWRTRDGAGRSVPIADLDLIPWQGRNVVIVFDSDVVTNDKVRAAEQALAEELTARGATVAAIRLPAGPDGEKVGLDDYLVVHTVEAFCQLEPLPLGVPPRLPAPIPVEFHDLMAQTFADEAHIVAGGIVTHCGLTVVGGAPKLGKSGLVEDLVILRSDGEDFLGFATTPGRSLIFNAEIPEPELQKRLGSKVLDRPAPPKGRVYFVTDRTLKLDQPEGLARLRQHIEQVCPDLVVIDPLARFMVGDENSTRDMGIVVAALDLLIQTYRVAIVLVHHTAKPSADGSRDGGHRLRGSSALFAAADAVLLLDKVKDGGFRLTFELRHGKEPDPMYLTRTPRLWFALDGPPQELRAVASLIASGPLRWGQLVEAVRKDQSASKRTAERLVDRAKKASLITPDGDGYYTATATYRHARSGGEVNA
jgi:AAA domain/Domain of unknown function (DUF3854)